LIFPQRRFRLIEVIAAMSAVYLFSAVYHFPESVVTPSHYSDINYIWFRESLGVGPHKFPYLDYNLEYPPIIGLVIWVASFFRSQVYYHYVTAVLQYPFALMTVISLYLTCRVKEIDISRIFVWCILTLSMIWFVYYSWDIIAIGFMAASIYFRAVNRTKTSSLFLGLGAAAKIMPIFLLPVFMQEEKKWTERFLVAGIALGGILAFNLPFMVCNFSSWLWTYTHTARWVNEDSFWLYVFGPYETYLSRVGSALLFYFFIIVVLTSKGSFFHKCWAMMASFLSSTYMFPPQFCLFLLPLFTLVPAVSLPLFYIFDLANVSIIILWFNQYGIYPAGPIDPASPVQWIASFRQLLLMFLLIKFLFPRLLTRNASFAFKSG